ncbi:N-acetylmuramoyl-L-alanine amidase [Bifidobacterium imperatoris]|uniref:N-acetylmuramoyl-L-alanine amidase n=1 Tax=Bifidobacterium imperatoris TaxID=2020965 RepID=A0A2N5IQU6_9BIFI|nr:N-acetylmuramoyl-L-alanine amidase [Bifidobacterium imperatoris]PLS24333.1 N-acetylmuramoyl-L-alanine amidase [Bifidobacterium imperatoris]QSY56963.1 N-acetylmuramoyl-L-alanine amidase [Bifidobacterium imperatoris]
MVGYSKALWKGSPNHYNGRNGYKVTHITLHIMVGSLEGTNACFQRPSYRASSTYGVGTDGTIYQWVDEANGAWCDANMASDCSGISIEHAGGIAGIAPTAAEYEASARLCADIARRYGWTKLWHDETGGRRGNIVLHREVPGTTHAGCPDRTINGLDVARVITRANQLLNGGTTPRKGNDMAEMLFNDLDTGKVYYWNILTGIKYIGVPDQLTVLKKAGVPEMETSSKGPWMTRAAEITDNTLASIKTTEAAQSAAIDALSKSMGADPGEIAKIVQDAVKSKLSSLEISMTATEKKG